MGDLSREERRILMVAISERDRVHTARLCREDSLEVDFCETVEELVYAAEEGAAAILLNDLALRRDHILPLLDFLSEQPAWSDLPTILVTAEERPSWLSKHGLVNVAILRQPVHVDTLLSVLRSAIASRVKQYQVRDLLHEQAETQAELRRADRRKDEFLATLAHELRNPIAPIKSALDLVELSRGSLQNEAELLGVMNRQVRQLTRIIDDLLDVSRITRGKIRLIREIIDLRDPVLAGVESSRPFIEQSKQTLTVNLGQAPIYVDGDASRLAQCVANLLNNAAKYTPPGGAIQVTARSAKGMIEIAVRDNGIGIAPEQISSVFELFRQHDVDRERGQAGLGIGLTLVQRLLDLHGGTISVESDGLNKGSLFTIRLPAASPPTPTSHGARPASTVDLSSERIGRRILLVEDTRAIRELTKQLLEIMGHTVTAAADGEQGLQAAQQEQYDAVLSDISMPRMNGLQLAKKLREDRRFDNTLLVAMTGYGRTEDREEALAAGFNRHLTKPVDAAVLDEIFAKLD